MKAIKMNALHVDILVLVHVLGNHKPEETYIPDTDAAKTAVRDLIKEKYLARTTNKGGNWLCLSSYNGITNHFDSWKKSLTELNVTL